MYANGLRVLHDISPALLDAVRAVGKPFEKRRWLRHDGSVVAVGDERFLCVWRDAAEAQRFQSIGIRRWRLQKVLYQACVAASIPVVFNERLERLEQPLSDTPVCVFASGLKVTADLLFGCDGLRSMVRASVFGSSTTTEPKYTGVTCFMGAAALPRREPGICFPSSRTTQCHAVFYPTADNEQVFQIYFPMPENIETWGTLSFEEGRRECNALADILQYAEAPPPSLAPSIVSCSLTLTHSHSRAERTAGPTSSSIRCAMPSPSFAPACAHATRSPPGMLAAS